MPTSLARKMFGPKLNVFCTSPYPLSPEDPDRTDCMFCPTLLLGFLTAHNGVIILPQDDRMVSLWNYHKELRGLHDWQVIWTRGNSYSLSEEAAANHVHEIRAAMKRLHGEWQLVPYAPGPGDYWLAHRLGGIPIIGDTPTNQREWDKGRLYPHIDIGSDSDRLSLSEMGLPVPKGFCFSDSVGATKARQALFEAGGTRQFMLKPVRSDGGNGVREINLTGNIKPDDVTELGLIEERVRGVRANAKKGPLITVSCHWGAAIQNQSRYVGPMWLQCMHGVVHNGNGRPFTLPTPFTWAETERKAQRIIREYLNLSGLVGVGGLDMVLREDGELLVIDPNLRPTYNAPCIQVYNENGGRDLSILSCIVKPSCSLEDFRNSLQEQGLEYKRTGDFGIYPYSFGSDRNSLFMVVAPNMAQAEEWRETGLDLAS